MVNFVRFGFTASMTWRQFSTVASKNSLERFSDAGSTRTRHYRARDIDAATRVNGVGNSATLDDIVQILLAPGAVRIEHVLPGADLSDDHVLRREGLLDSLLPGRIAESDVGTVSRAVAQTTVFLRKLGGVVRAQKDRSAEPHFAACCPCRPCRKDGRGQHRSSCHANSLATVNSGTSRAGLALAKLLRYKDR